MSHIVSEKFNNTPLKLKGEARSFTGVSRASRSLARLIRNLKGRRVLDLGCGIGYMSLGALCSGAKEVIATDKYDVEKALRGNLRMNNISQRRLRFIQGDMFGGIPTRYKFDVIIANLPQHALPATARAKKLSGKYGGYDGTDLVCRGLSEGAGYLKRGGRFYMSVSELTNYRRTMTILHSLYDIKKSIQDKKKLDQGEMMPYVSDNDLLRHLRRLAAGKLIATVRVRFPVLYKVRRYELVRR